MCVIGQLKVVKLLEVQHNTVYSMLFVGYILKTVYSTENEKKSDGTVFEYGYLHLKKEKKMNNVQHNYGQRSKL